MTSIKVVFAKAKVPLPICLCVGERLVPLLRCHAFPPKGGGSSSEMFFEVGGLNGRRGRVSLAFPPRERDDRERNAGRTRYEYKDALPCDIPIHHISVHSSGLCHLKPVGKDEPIVIGQRLEGLSKTSPRFLQLNLVTEAAGLYRWSEAIDSASPSVLLRCTPDNMLLMEAFFSGAEFDLLGFVAPRLGEGWLGAGFRGGSLQGLVFARQMEGRGGSERPPGTILAFRFYRDGHSFTELSYHVV